MSNYKLGNVFVVNSENADEYAAVLGEALVKRLKATEGKPESKSFVVLQVDSTTGLITFADIGPLCPH